MYILYIRVCVLVYATLWEPNVPTSIVKPDILDIVGPHEEKNKYMKCCLSDIVTMQTDFL